MLIYATVTSERATKGQGGKYIEIQVKNESGAVIFEANITPTEIYATTFGDDAQSIETDTKGEKQKDECRHHYNYVGNTDTLCNRCTFCNEPRK